MDSNGSEMEDNVHIIDTEQKAEEWIGEQGQPERGTNKANCLLHVAMSLLCMFINYA